MQKTTKKWTAILCAAVVVGLLGLFLAAILFPLIGEACGEAVAMGFLLVYGLGIVAVIVGVLMALRQRLKEIKGGEEDEAKKY